MQHLQPADHPAPTAPRTALHHGGMFRLLGYALVGPQGHRHTLGNAPEA